MNRTDLTIALCFVALGAGLLVTSFGFPAGIGPLPGPGFFPTIIGCVILVLAGALALSAWRAGPAELPAVVNLRALAATTVLLAAYLAFWGVVPFAPRTFVFSLLFLRLLRTRWLSAATVSAVLTTAVFLAFQLGLRVTLD